MHNLLRIKAKYDVNFKGFATFNATCFCDIFGGMSATKVILKSRKISKNRLWLNKKPVGTTLKGETVPSKVTLPDCDGKTCPEFTVERLQK